MSVFKCKMCGGTLEVNEKQSTAVCEYCGTKQTLPRLDDDRRANLYDRANHFRRNNEFDKAMGIYEQILNEDNTDAEAYWSLVLCRYGIEYVEDPASHKRLPTVNRAQFTSVFDDDNYKSALKNADSYQKLIYEEEAAAINEIQKGILSISQKEEPFDVFICYKETDASGRRTQDSVLANDLYHQLTNEGFRVFFARITLEDKLGSAYEPYIFAALNSAKVMVVLGTKPEHFNAVWVKNEWSRYLALVKSSGGKKVLIPAYRDMDPYDLPEEFSHLQAQDMSKLGFMQDLIRGIKKLTATDEPKPAVIRETVTVNSGASGDVAPLLKRAFMFLEDGEWDSADEYCEKVLDIDPENAEAYLGKLMAQLECRKREALKDYAKPFDEYNNYKKALRFGDEKLKAELTGYIKFINDRNENKRLTGIYNRGLAQLRAAKTESEYKSAAEIFKGISAFEDADAKAAECLEKAEIARKEAEKARKNDEYQTAKNEMRRDTVATLEKAAKLFSSLSGWKDSDKQAEACRKRIEELNREAENRRIAREREAEARRIAAEKRAKSVKKAVAIVTPTVTVCVIFVVLLINVIIPNVKYNSALRLYENGKYEEAIAAFKKMDGYKDSFQKIEICQTAIKCRNYDAALELYKNGKYEEAIAKFEKINGYKDSSYKIIEVKYDYALDNYEKGKYEEAIALLNEISAHKDTRNKLKEVKYNYAIKLFNDENYSEARSLFESLYGYNDSNSYILKCLNGSFGENFVNAKVGDTLTFGGYEQDNDTSNGIEAIEWIILDKNNGKVLLLSKYGLDCQKYNTQYADVTWETCTLRKWLNETFINEAFSAEEQARIQTSTVTADKNPKCETDPGKDTKDKIFLLSISEANKYFKSDDERKCGATDHAKSQDAWTSDSYSVNGKVTCWWWLRSPGYYQYDVAYIYDGGSVAYSGGVVDYDHVCVRPAMWIDISE